MASGDTLPRGDAPDAAHLLAVGLIAGDLTPLAIARFAEVTTTQAKEALEWARFDGLLTDDGVDELTAARLIADLDRDEQARIHAAVARHAFTVGHEQLPTAIRHLRAAGTLGAPEPMVEQADHAGRLSLSLGDYQAAHDLLALADELDASGDLSAQGRRLCDLATATDGLGRVEDARRHLARAMSLGELANDAPLMARAAVMHTLPVDWYAGDPRTIAFLARAQAADERPHAQVAIQAARALAEIRIPVTTSDGHQYAWVTRPNVAQPLAEEALAASKDYHPEIRCLAAMAWRTTHRAPEVLDRRREVATLIMDLAQQLRLPTMQVEGAVWLAVDALESGDRGLYDEALSVARWVSHADGNPRLKWRSLTLSLGAALLDENYDAAERLRSEARALSDAAFSPGPQAVEMFFLGQELIGRDDPTTLGLVLLPDSEPGLANPVARAAVAYGYARTGDHDTATQFVRRALRQLDKESSYLLVCTRAAAAAVATGDQALARELIGLLTPWVDHVSVDGNGWWCDGPVALWLAQLHHLLGHEAQARTLLAAGEAQARALNDLRSLRRASALKAELPATSAASPSLDLSPRELAVLELLASGATNPSIARTLAYSLSTIRNDTISIYRKMGVTGRPEAVAKAINLGLVAPTN